MFKKRKELQSLVDTTRKSLANAEMQIAERNKMIRDLIEENRILKEKNKNLEIKIEDLKNKNKKKSKNKKKN